MSEVPVIIRDKIKTWKILTFTERDWSSAFQGRTLTFRKGYKTYKENPYWEQLCEKENMPISEFFNISKTEDTNEFWLYYDYKYTKDVFPENSDVIQAIKWTDLGLTELSGKDSTLWIGNKGAHTPCHMDTYGCNLVAQIKGRKLWILIPPGETDSLSPVRVPYEESSVYSSYNFYTPNSNLLRIKNARKVILNPGEVLFIPKHWWHYVENLEVAVSVNVWIPEGSDDGSRLEEALVRHYVSNVCQTLGEDEAKALLNPNEYGLLEAPFEAESLRFVIDNCRGNGERRGASDDLRKLKPFLEKNGDVIPEFPPAEVDRFVKSKSRDLGYELRSPKSRNLEGGCEEDNISTSRALINSYCHPKVVALIKEKILGECL
ncbi:UNVERIFIED_CONTAM: hypothetical protein PYX00_007187 [Menopon gallinae]|uniref:JmjC domain-containing protein n=1 Tax=Menopon gallinae TaxID=328185 RepID=A0AAW2HI62_9NEOP